MTDEPLVPETPDARITRLERSVSWLKVAALILIAAVVALFIPPIAAAIGLMLVTIIICGGVVVLITSMICLLERAFPDRDPKS